MKLSKIASYTAPFLLFLFLLIFVGDSDLSAQFRASRVKKTQNIQTYVLNSFENPDQWKVSFSMFAAKKFEPAKKTYIVDKTKCQSRLFDGKPWGVSAKNEKKVLAVKAAYDRKGYNWVEVAPVKPLPMVGKVQAVDLWVWGGNFKYRMELHLEDYRGFKHIIDAGWLDYVGWKNIRLSIPTHIPQGERYIPRLKTLRFVKFVLYSHPAERNDIFYVYFDRMQIQSDVYLGRFDGDDLVKQGFKTGWMPEQDTLMKKKKKTTGK